MKSNQQLTPERFDSMLSKGVLFVRGHIRVVGLPLAHLQLYASTRDGRVGGGIAYEVRDHFMPATAQALNLLPGLFSTKAEDRPLQLETIVGYWRNIAEHAVTTDPIVIMGSSGKGPSTPLPRNHPLVTGQLWAIRMAIAIRLEDMRWLDKSTPNTSSREDWRKVLNTMYSRLTEYLVLTPIRQNPVTPA